MDRRRFLQTTAGMTGAALTGSALANVFIWSARAEGPVPVADLQKNLTADEALILVPNSPQFATYQVALNKRTLLTPQVRVVVRTPQAIATALQWAKANQVPFALRAGGHSYEGFSQSRGMVIDVRLLNGVTTNPTAGQLQIGAGLALGQIYKDLAPHGMVIPAGSCPTVGASGHTLGGGYGLLARPLGLATDNVLEMEMVNAEGQVLTLSPSENQDLFWAMRGGGAGSFGVVTQFTYQTHNVRTVTVFGISWSLNQERAAHLLQSWLSWAPELPSEINSIIKVSKSKNGTFSLRCFGQSLGTAQKLSAVLKQLTATEGASIEMKTMPFLDAVTHFAGSWNYPSVFMKGKSDYLTQNLSDQGAHTLLQNLPIESVSAIFDSYGGAISNIAPDATAFAHRRGTLCAIQYYSEWENAAETEGRLATMRSLYDSMRPYVSGGSYVNYCDLDLKNYAQAYWGANLARLTQLKSLHDPENFFKHAQSVPLKS